MLEIAINRVLAFSNQAKLIEKHAGKVLNITLTDIHLTLFLVFQKEKLLVYTVYSDQPDATIEGSSLSFLKQLRGQNNFDALLIEGDIDFAHDMQLLIHGVDIEWEEYLSYLTGDFLANRLGAAFHQAKQSTASITKRTVEDLVDYLQEEKRFLPTKEEVEDFYEDILLLRQDIDRLNARIDRLMEKVDK